MKVALLQLAPEQSSELNFEKAIKYIQEAALNGADIALLPEIWTVGYVGPEDYALGAEAWHNSAIIQGDTEFEKYKNIASENSIAVAFGYLERASDQLFDSVALIDMNGEMVLNYRKIQTVRKNWEEMLSAGTELFVADLQTQQGTVKVGTMICFDREFPEIARILMHKGAELLLVPNACDLETNRLSQFQARGFENMLGVAMANYPSPKHNGKSVAFDGMRKKGEDYDPTLVLAGEDEGLFYAEFDISKLREYRQKEIWGDAYRKPWLYGELIDDSKSQPFLRDNAEVKD